MLECKCFRNLIGFAVSRPPCVIFTVCLATFAVGLFSLGYYVQTHGGLPESASRIKEWSVFIEHVNAKHFCIAKNVSINTLANQSSLPNSTALVHLSIPVVLTLYPAQDFHGHQQNISHVMAIVEPAKLGFRGLPQSQALNITLSLDHLWSVDCSSKKTCRVGAFETCGSLLLPEKLVPQNMPRQVCNASSLVENVASMHSAPESSAHIVCKGEVVARVTIPRPVKTPVTEGNPITLVDSSTVNLRLQYSGYFLFVLVLSSILYGMIKGKPVKQTQKKPGADLVRQF